MAVPRVSSRWIPQREEYYVQIGSMFENPHGVPHDEIVRMILENPAEVVAQTVFGKYVELSGLVFSGSLIQMAINRALPRIRGNTYIDKDAVQQARIAYGPVFADGVQRSGERGDWGFRYHTGVDFGRQTDFTVLSTLDCAYMPARLVYWRRLNRVPWESIYGEVGKARELFGPNILVDGSGPAGDVILDALESRAFCPIHQQTLMIGQYCQRDGKMLGGCSQEVYLPLNCVEPYVFSQQSKRELVEHLRNTMSTGYSALKPDSPFGWLRVPPIAQLEEEWAFYSWEDKKLMTDCLFSLALSAWSGLEDPVGVAVAGSPAGA